jgi:hypothetical protein
MDKCTQAINEQIKIWNVKPYDINNGQCEDFAMAVIKSMGGYSDTLEEVATESFNNTDDLPGHVWIYYGDKYYDAECPEGVSDWRELPIFKKALQESPV